MYRLVALGLGYLLGGIQSAILYGRFKGIEIRNHGSGNAGATNTLRVLAVSYTHLTLPTILLV